MIAARICLTLALLAATACGPAAAAPASRPAQTCHARPDGAPLLVLPDASCTPGSTNPDVTPATLAATICKTGWTATIRPPVSYTEPLKRRQMTADGFTDPISVHEEDHLIPLELGGAPRDPHNLWPEPGRTPNPKDGLENRLKSDVCAGRVPLGEAQHAIATDWVAAVTTYGAQATTGDTTP
jgi:hypothetical protein